MKTTMNIGTLELRNLYHRYMAEGLIVAGLFHFALIGGTQVVLRYYNIDDKIPPIILRGPIDLIPPIFNDRPTLPIVSIAKQNLASEGIPVPIPETDFNLEKTIPNQTAMNGESGIENGVEGGTGTIVSEGTVIIVEETAPEIFNPGIEKYPVPVYNPPPAYPEIARRSGIEGTVYIKMWVTKEGKVKQAEIVKSTSNIFDQSAMDAAVTWKFTPAIMNNGPVSVWVTVPFKFRLKM